MALKSSVTIKQKKFPTGATLLESNASVRLLVILHEGSVCAVNTSLNSSQKHYIYSLKKNSIIGFGALLSRLSSPVRYVTQVPSLISAFPVGNSFSQTIMDSMRVGMMAARSLLNEIYSSYQMVSQLGMLTSQMSKLIDNLALSYRYCVPELFQSKQVVADEEHSDPILEAAHKTVAMFEKKGGQYANSKMDTWLQTDHSDLLGVKYIPASRFNSSNFRFYQKLLSLPNNIQNAMYKSDIGILEGLTQQLHKILFQNIEEVHDVQKSVKTKFDILMNGKYSYAEKLNMLMSNPMPSVVKVKRSEVESIIRFFYKNCKLIIAHSEKLQKISYGNQSQSLNKISKIVDSYEEGKENKSSVLSAGRNSDTKNIQQELHSSPEKIISLLKIETEDAKNILEALKKLKSFSSPLDGNQEARKLRRTVTAIYTKIWEKGYKLYRKNTEEKKNTPKLISLMLNFGFFDEELLDEKHLSYIYNLSEIKYTSSYPIKTGIEWLGLVCDKGELPSVDELGQSYFDKLKLDNRDAGWKRESDVPESVNTMERRLQYEMDAFFATNVRLTSGVPTTYLPILNRYQLTMPIEKALLTQKKVENAIKDILTIDFSAFHHEVIVNDENLKIFREFIQKQIFPYFIIMPSTGTKIMMWQEIAGRNKSSRARFALPIFATSDIFILLAEAVAVLRWEMTKTIQGANWNDVSQPSITADYTDYVQFFKRNSELSIEVKEKLSSEFKRFRSDRDRFTNDYIQWLKYESQGILKLNKVSRNIFYRHIPFAKEIRDRVSKQPAFLDIHNRFRNISSKKHRQLEARYRKFGENPPEDFQANLDFYKV